MWFILLAGYLVGVAALREFQVPEHHFPLWAKFNDSLNEECLRDPFCQIGLRAGKCWGYEQGCTAEKRFHKFKCDGPDQGWTKQKGRPEQEKQFFETADFGYIDQRQREMSIVCRGSDPDDSVLECVDHARLCRLRNVFMDFSRLKTLEHPVKYRGDILGEDLIGGHCRLNLKRLKSLGQHNGALQSWFRELEHFTVVDEPVNTDTCDVFLEEPTIVVKLDATVNMYHHFCDFVNLYASLHFNQTISSDVNVIVWDGRSYRSNFRPMWKTITSKPLRFIGEFKDQGRICFRNLLMPFPPRMISGLYYNMPLMPGCQGSGLMKAFKEHTLHRLNVTVSRPSSKIRVTFLSRSTDTRRILNEDELVDALQDLDDIEVRKVDFSFEMDFLEQLKISANTDVLIGIHGAGLTHALFLPEWAALFELYDCGDPNCYSDLSRLAGVTYVTWEDPSKIESFPSDRQRHNGHEKFNNYKFDANHFMTMVSRIVRTVQHTLAEPKAPIHDEM